MGAIAFLTTRVALAKNELNLGSWHGYQELYLKNKSYKKKVSFSYSLVNEESYFLFFFGTKDQNRLALRISKTKDFPNCFVLVDEEGKFTQKTLINIKTNNMIKGKVTLLVSTENTTKFILNNDTIYLPKQLEKSLSRNLIGFRGGANQVIIDTISIDPNSTNALIENFSNYSQFFKYFITSLLLLISIFLLVDFMFQKFIFHFSVFCFVVLVFVIVDYFYLSQIYPLTNPNQSLKYQVNIEDEEQTLQKIDKSINNKFSHNVLFIGSSQTWGAGAQKVEHTFIYRINNYLNISPDNKFQFINAGISGWNSSRSFKQYVDRWALLNPKTVFINFSNNDTDITNFEKNLEKFSAFNNKNNIKTIFILEANSTGYLSDNLNSNHKVMLNIAQKYKLKVIDLHNYLVQKQDTGLLWWDFVHLTSYGQYLAAKKIYQEFNRVP